MKSLVWLLPVFLSGLFFLSGCSKSGPKGQLSADKQIDSLYLLSGDHSPFLTGDLLVSLAPTDTINVSVPAYTDITQLIPIISIKGKTISPASGVAQDFSSPVTYTVTAEDGSQVHYTVVVRVRGLVFFGDSKGAFYALDAVKGSLRWKTATAGNFYYSSPALVNGVIYAGNTDHNMYAIDARTGKVKWAYPVGSSIESSPAVSGGMLYFGCDDYTFYALDTLGNLKWTYTAGRNIGSSPVVVNGVVYFGSDDTYINALDAVSGTVIWRYQAGSIMNQSSPAVVDGVLYIGCRDGNLYALNAATGTLRWKYYANGISLEMSSPAVAYGNVYIGGWYNTSDFTQVGSLYAVDAASGILKWQSLDNLGIGSDPEASDSLLYVTCDDTYLYAVNSATGAIVWSKQILANGASAKAAGSTLYVGGGGSWYFYALDARNGFIKWEYYLTGTPVNTSTPVIFGNTE